MPLQCRDVACEALAQQVGAYDFVVDLDHLRQVSAIIEVEHLPQRHAHGLRLLGDDASRAHAGNGVDLDQIRFAFGRDDEIDAHHARAAARLVGDACHAVQFFRDFGCDLRRGYLVRIPFGVFGLVVEEVLLGDDLRDREQILPAPGHHHAAAHFAACRCTLRSALRRSGRKPPRRRAAPRRACGLSSRRTSCRWRLA